MAFNLGGGFQSATAQIGDLKTQMEKVTARAGATTGSLAQRIGIATGAKSAAPATTPAVARTDGPANVTPAKPGISLGRLALVLVGVGIVGWIAFKSIKRGK